MARFPRSWFLAGIIFLFAPFLAGFTNPHVATDSCGSCHTRVPTVEEAEGGIYCLVEDTVDETCGICHSENRCLPDSKHANHPSGINRWDVNEFRTPKTLPLFNGYITCHTCHLHTKPGGADYKMVRIVKIGTGYIDWSDLCRDCHDH